VPAPPVTALLRASHPGPSVAVTALTLVLSLAVGHGTGRALLVAGAVGAGQLTIGWSNDLIDLSADRQVRRADKPVARGDVAPRTVRGAIVVAAVLCLVLSVLCGPASAAVHLLLGVGGGWAYNLGLKRTVWSFVPYVAAFGSLPAVATLALPRPVPPPAWMVATGALLGVGAHLLNALPDLADDARTGVRGLPQRLGAGRVRVLAPLLLLGASVVAVLVPPGGVPAWGWAVLALCGLLALVALSGRGRVPFAAAIAIAAVDVVTLVLR
jgi:4-hydroxybenzoate polyprenyltransferase